MPDKGLVSYTAVLRNVDTSEVVIVTAKANSIDAFSKAMNLLGYVIVDEKVKRTEVFLELILSEIPDEKWHPKRIRIDFTEVTE